MQPRMQAVKMTADPPARFSLSPCCSMAVLQCKPSLYFVFGDRTVKPQLFVSDPSPSAPVLCVCVLSSKSATHPLVSPPQPRHTFICVSFRVTRVAASHTGPADSNWPLIKGATTWSAGLASTWVAGQTNTFGVLWLRHCPHCGIMP